MYTLHDYNAESVRGRAFIKLWSIKNVLCGYLKNKKTLLAWDKYIRQTYSV